MIATIKGVGFFTPWGHELSGFNKNYKEMNCSLVDTNALDRFDSTEHIGAHKLSPIENFNAKDFFKSKNMRKYNVQTRLAIASAKRALESVAEQSQPGLNLADMGAVYSNLTHSTETGNFLRSMIVDGVDFVSPRIFPMSTPNLLACHVSTELGITGPTINLDTRFASGYSTLYNGINLIRAGHTENVLATSVDYQTQLILELYSRFGAHKRDEEDDAMYPTDAAVSMILGGTEDAELSFGKVLAMSFTGSHAANYKWPSDSSSHERTLLKVIGEHQIDVYSSSSNGVRAVQAIEEKTYESLFANVKGIKKVKLKETIGEAATMPMVQVLAACAEPKGKKTLISILGTGGLHGAMLIESTGRWQTIEDGNDVSESIAI